MRAFVKRPLAFAIIGLALLCGRALAQSDKSLTQYRLEMERAREEIIELFNEVNSGDDNDVTCRSESASGTRTRQRVCRSNSANRADTNAAKEFLNSLFLSSGISPAAGTQVNEAIGTGVAQGEAAAGGAAAQDALQKEMERLLGENRELYQAVVKYVELEDEYNRARGSTTVRPGEELNVSIEVRAPVLASAQCSATTTTEYYQQNAIARVNSTLEIADCTTASGAFTVVLRIRDGSGEDKPLEFNETWQRSDDQNVKFAADYPIGENVELVSARVRRLSCTCADPATED